MIVALKYIIWSWIFNCYKFPLHKDLILNFKYQRAIVIKEEKRETTFSNKLLTPTRIIDT